MTGNCKKCGMKSILNEIQDGQRRKHRKLRHIGLEDNPYEDIVIVYATEDEESESDHVYLGKVRIQEYENLQYIFLINQI